MTGYNDYFGIVAGVLATAAGVCAIVRPASVASWLQHRGVPHPTATDRFLRQIRTLGILFILAGGFFLVVAIRSR